MGTLLERVTLAHASKLDYPSAAKISFIKCVKICVKVYMRLSVLYSEGLDRGGGGGTGVEGAESGVEGAESGVEGAGSGGGKREAGIEGAGSLERFGREIVFFYRKFKENGSFMPISYIKVHQEKYAILSHDPRNVWRQ